MFNLQFFKSHKILLGIIFLGAALRFWGIRWGLPYEYQSEEYKVIKYALRMGSGDLNPHFFEYPSLDLYFMLFLFGLYYLGGNIFGFFKSVTEFSHHYIQDPTPFYLIARGAEAVFGIGIIILTYHIGKKLASKKAGLLASFMVAVLPDFVNKSHLAKGDSAAIFLGLLFFIFCLNLYESGQKKWYFWAGATLGLALSTKYYLVFIGVALPLAHFLSSGSRKNKNFILSLILIPIFFILGSPYLLVEWKSLLNFFSSNFYLGLYGASETNYFFRLWIALKNLIRLSDFNFYFWLDSYGLGIFSLVSMLLIFCSPFRLEARESSHLNKKLLLILPILTYWLGVATYHNPAGGYLAPIFPLLLICASIFTANSLFPPSSSSSPFPLSSFRLEARESRVFILILFLISSLGALGASVQRSYSYTLEDTRTTAKNWIEANIPSGSKILMDTYVNSPPIEMSQEQLERFYQISLSQNSYKEKYFKLKLETFQPEKPNYEIYLIKRTAAEIGSLKEQVEEAQKTQDLISMEGSDADFAALRKAAIEYIIVNSSSETNALTQHPHLGKFYHNIPTQTTLLKTFPPKTKIHPGPALRLYKLS